MTTHGGTWRPTWVIGMPYADARDRDGPIGSLTDAELVRACLDGRPDAFDVIVERHQRTVYRLCYRFVSNREDASDLSQEVFLRAFRALHRFRGDATLGTWLHRIAVNACLTRVSAQAPATEPINADRHIDEREEPAAEQLVRAERAERVRDALAQLPEKQRAALILRVYEEMTHREIAITLGTSVGAAKANVFHALRNLKRLLGSETV
ncbi:MAG: sigma-70 family RNA polymerase sigma factor [Acidimicrobiia bacterium]|nr:sigma-70 family RNA polymerase sigma factor [Acidimicrobiia bacterium]